MRKRVKSLPILATITFLSTLAPINISAEATKKINCAIPEKIMFSILLNEQTSKRRIDYPFIIRTNYTKERNPLKHDMSVLILKDMGNKSLYKTSDLVYDCQNMKQCISTVKLLEEYDLKNVDLGPFQVNYLYHPNKIEKYFNFNSAYNLACKYVEELVYKKGYSWDSIATYHSNTTKHKSKYLKNLLANYERVESATSAKKD